MRSRPLGQTGVSVPRLGFGVSGPHATPLVPASRTAALIRHAYEAGVRTFDTAPFYGRGEAERRLAAGIGELPREDLFVITKAGTINSGLRYAKNFEPDAIAAQFRESLTRMRLDYADALLLHGPSPRHLTDALFKQLSDLKDEGLARHVGVCVRGAEADGVLRDGVFDLIMLPVRMDMGKPLARRIAHARDAGLGVIGIEALTPAQHSIRLPRSPADAWYTARSLIRPTGRLTVRRTPAQCLSWSLTSGGADVVVTTTTRPAHLTASAEVAAAARP